MPRTGEMIESNYLKKEDFDEDGTIVTVRKFERKNVAKETDLPEFKWIMYFKEYDKGIVLNSTNIQLAEAAFGSDNTDDWEGKEIIIYVDPNVSYQGKLIGGLRLRAHRKAGPPKSATPRQPIHAEVRRDMARTPGEDDDIPYDPRS